MHNIHTMLTPTEIAIYAVLGSVIGLAVTYSIALRRARQWTVVTLRLVSMEALATAFVGLAAILSFHEGGFVGLIATFTTALFAGLLYRIYGVHLGVLYMAFYGSAYLSGTLLPALTRWFP